MSVNKRADTERLPYTSFLIVLVISALFLAIHLIYLFASDAQRFPINTVKIVANYQHISRHQLETVLANYLKNSFFALPIQQLYHDLIAFDWAKEVRIQRVWPDTLKIVLLEKIPIATWNNTLLTQDGQLVKEEKAVLTNSSLPHLSGPINQQKEVLQVYEKMSKILSIYGLHAASLEWRENQAWELTLANGVLLRLGKQDLEARILRFCKAYPAVFAEKSEQLTSVDLRYPHGMAVQWKKETRR